jgi:bifunctional DNA-binding transcriptional regulator/antitoxin component of YhaV-PrlF toxin-antitoxin module
MSIEYDRQRRAPARVCGQDYEQDVVGGEPRTPLRLHPRPQETSATGGGRWRSRTRAHGALSFPYHPSMAGVVTAKVSQRGQTSLPAGLRRRWGIANGGDVAFIDLGGTALVLPGGMAAAKAEVRQVLGTGAYAEGLAVIDDPDLAV